MTTAADVIKLALKDIQVLDETEEPSAALMSDGMSTLNQLLAMWQIDKLFVYAQVDTTKAATGASTYTIGTGGDFNISQPARIDYAFLRSSNIDYPIEILSNWDEYLAISLKVVSGALPSVLYLNQGVTTGTIYVYPQPTSGTIHLITSVTLPTYTATANDITLPPEYVLPIRFSLAEILAMMLGVDLRPDIAKLAKNTRGLLRRNNFKVKSLDLGGNGLPYSVYPAILGGGA